MIVEASFTSQQKFLGFSIKAEIVSGGMTSGLPSRNKNGLESSVVAAFERISAGWDRGRLLGEASRVEDEAARFDGALSFARGIALGLSAIFGSQLKQ
jgi:hypothetical protein